MTYDETWPRFYDPDFKDFANWIWEEFIERKEAGNVVVARELAARVDYIRVISEVAKEFGVKKEDVFKSNRGQKGENIIRGIALHLIFNHTGLTQHELGRIAEQMSATAVSAAIRRFSELLRRDKKQQKVYDRILNTWQWWRITRPDPDFIFVFFLRFFKRGNRGNSWSLKGVKANIWKVVDFGQWININLKIMSNIQICSIE